MIKNLIQEINSFNDTNEKRLTGFPSQKTFIRIFKLYYYLPIPKSYQLNYQLVQYVHCSIYSTIMSMVLKHFLI